MIFIAYPQLHKHARACMHAHTHTHTHTNKHKKEGEKNVVSGYVANMANINDHLLSKFLRKRCTGILKKKVVVLQSLNVCNIQN